MSVRGTDVSFLASSVSSNTNNKYDDALPSLVCDENMDESAAATGVTARNEDNIDPSTATTTTTTSNLPLSRLSNHTFSNTVLPSPHVLHLSRNDIYGRLPEKHQNTNEKSASKHLSSNKTVVYDKYLVESYKNSVRRRRISTSRPTNERNTTNRPMTLDDLSLSDLQLLDCFPLSNSCSLSESAVKRMAAFLVTNKVDDEKKDAPEKPLAPPSLEIKLESVRREFIDDDDDADKTLSADEAALPPALESKKQKEAVNGMQKPSTKSASVGIMRRKIRALNAPARAGRPRTQDVLLHLLPATTSQQNENDDSNQLNIILNYLAAESVRDDERRRLVDGIMSATVNSDNNVDNNYETKISKSESMQSSGRKQHRVAAEADLFSSAFGDLVSLIPMPSQEKQQHDVAAHGDHHDDERTTLNSTAGLLKSTTSTNLPDDEQLNTLQLPAANGESAYATALEKALLNDGEKAVVSSDKKRSGDRNNNNKLIAAQRTANVVRKCLAVEIPIRHTCTFPLVDIGSTLLAQTSNCAADKFFSHANAALLAITRQQQQSDIGMENVAPPSSLLNGASESWSLPLRRPANDTIGPNQKTANISSAVEVGGKAAVSVTFQEKHENAGENENFEPIAASKLDKQLKRRRRPSADNGTNRHLKKRKRRQPRMSVLKRLATLGVRRNRQEKREPLSLAQAYEPPLKSFYDLIDVTLPDHDTASDDNSVAADLLQTEKAARSVDNQLAAASILGAVESMQLIRSWFMAQLLAVRAETHPHMRLAKRQALLRKYYGHLVSAYKLKKSAVRVREQANIDFDACRKESNRMLDRCKQSLVMMFEDKRKLIELEKTLDIATNRYDLSRSIVSTRAARKTRGGQPVSAAASADVELLLSLGSGNGPITSSSPPSAAAASTMTSSSSTARGGEREHHHHHHHHTLYPDHHDILGGNSSTTLPSGGENNMLSSSSSSRIQQQHNNFMTSNRASLLHAAAAVVDRGGLASSSNAAQQQKTPFHRPQLISYASGLLPGGAATTGGSIAGYFGGGPSNTTGATTSGNSAATAGGASSAAAVAAAGSDRPWLPTANSMLNFKKRRPAALSQLLKTEIDEADMLSDLAYLNGSSQTMQNSSVSKRKRQTAIKSNVRVDSNRLMIDEHAFHRNQVVVVEPSASSAAAMLSGSFAAAGGQGMTSGQGGGGGFDASCGAAGQFTANILSFSAGEIWLRRSSDQQKFKVSLGQLMDGSYKLSDVHSRRK